MKKLLTRIIGAATAFAMAIGVGFAVANNRGTTRLDADPGDEITAIANIVSGKSYYIKGVRTNGTVEYLTFTDAVGSQSGTSSSTTSGATALTFTAVDGGYNITTPSGKYIAPGTSNGKIAVSASSVIVSATNQSSKIRLSIISGTDTWSIQKNKTAANFGGYKNTQNDITLIEASAATVTGVSVSGSMSTTSYTTVQSWSNAGLTATATMSDSSSYNGVFTWAYSPTSPAAAVAANSGNAIASLAVTATASAQGKSGSKETSGISVSLASVAQVAAVTPASGTLENVIAKGVVSQVDAFNDSYHSITYWISDDGTTTNQYEVYGGKGVGNTDFNDINGVQVGDIVVVYGNVKTHEEVKEFSANNYLLSLVRPTISGVSASIKDGTYYAGATLSASDFNVTVTWTGGKADTHPTEGFTWIVGDEPNGTLSEGNNAVVVTYEGHDSASFNVVGAPASASDVIENTLTTQTTLAYHYSKTPKTVNTVLNKAFTGMSGTSYGGWNNNASSGISYTGNSAAGNNAIQLRSSNSSGIVTSANTGERTAKKVTIVWNSNTADDRTVDVYGKNTAYAATSNLYDNSLKGTLLGSIVKGTSTVLEIDGSYKFIGFRSNNGALYLDSVTIEWSDGYNYSYSNMSIRFGGLLTKTLWDELDTNEHVISGFGVMITTNNVIGESEYIKDLAEAAEPAASNPNLNSDIANYYMPKTGEPSMATPPEDGSGNNYLWNLFFSIEDTVNGLNDVYVAAAYIKVGDNYVFFKQVRYSVKTLAQDYLDHRDCDDSTAEGSLANLAA